LEDERERLEEISAILQLIGLARYGKVEGPEEEVEEQG